MDDDVPCQWCLATIEGPVRGEHERWHVLNGLHGVYCTKIQPGMAGASCSCGVDMERQMNGLKET